MVTYLLTGVKATHRSIQIKTHLAAFKERTLKGFLKGNWKYSKPISCIIDREVDVESAGWC